MSLTRRAALTVLTLSPLVAPRAIAAAALAPDDQALVDKAVAYLEGIAGAKARFLQTDYRGGTAGGELYLQRPGRARFAYDPPSDLLITSDGKTVTVSHSRLKTLQRYPLNSTPLGLFLASHIRLDRGVKVTGVARSAGAFSITARDVHSLAQGEITLDFTDAPVRLTGWTILDAQRRRTRVDVQGLSPAGDLTGDLFVQTRPPAPTEP
ncbi:MAG: outer membrane lipoprotein carrier protein LolA [Caulobacterales bacterium]